MMNAEMNGKVLMVDVSNDELENISKVVVGSGHSCRIFYEDAFEIHPTSEPPKIGVTVLVFGKRGSVYPAIYYGKDSWKNGNHLYNGWWKVGAKNHLCDPVAWMPMPKLYMEGE